MVALVQHGPIYPVSVGARAIVQAFHAREAHLATCDSCRTQPRSAERLLSRGVPPGEVWRLTAIDAAMGGHPPPPDFGLVMDLLQEAERRLRDRENMPAKGVSVVYFVRAGDLVKVGVSGDLAHRLKGIQTGCPRGLELLAWHPGDRALEEDCHFALHAQWVRGEWFTDGPEVAGLVGAARAGTLADLFSEDDE